MLSFRMPYARLSNAFRREGESQAPTGPRRFGAPVETPQFSIALGDTRRIADREEPVAGLFEPPDSLT